MATGVPAPGAPARRIGGLTLARALPDTDRMLIPRRELDEKLTRRGARGAVSAAEKDLAMTPLPDEAIGAAAAFAHREATGRLAGILGARGHPVEIHPESSASRPRGGVDRC